MKTSAKWAPRELECEARRLNVIMANFTIKASDLEGKCFLKEKDGKCYVYTWYEGHAFPIPKEVARRIMDRDYNFTIEVEIRKVVDQFGHEDSTMYHVNIIK